jgi:hypothetical protein
LRRHAFAKIPAGGGASLFVNLRLQLLARAAAIAICAGNISAQIFS